MVESTRRAFLSGAAAAGAALYAGDGHATLLRGLTLPELVQRGERIVVLEPFDTTTQYIEIGGRRSIVTDTRVGVHETWAGEPESELLLRTLGGRINGVAELVHGQPVLVLGERAIGFLKRARDGQAWWTVGMAQGHFPVTGASETSRLLANRGLPSILKLEASAVRQLVGREVGEARELVRQARLR